MAYVRTYKGKCFMCNLDYIGDTSLNRSGFCSYTCRDRYLKQKYNNGNTILRNKGLSIIQWKKEYVFFMPKKKKGVYVIPENNMDVIRCKKKFTLRPFITKPLKTINIYFKGKT